MITVTKHRMFTLQGFLGLFGMALLLGSLSANAAPVLNVVGGQLMGATGIAVGGSIYDVQFVDGSCTSLFNGCDAPSDFTFHTSADAIAASQALLDSVFIDSGLGAFDSNPSLTNGCTTGPCFVTTVYAGDGNLASNEAARNDYAESGDLVVAPTLSASYDESDPSHNSAARTTFARWTFVSSAAPVPEPSSLALLGLGLVGFWGARLRRSGKAGA